MARPQNLCVVVVLLMLAGVVSAGELRVCQASAAPFLTMKDGKPTGIENDILSGFAEKEGMQLKLTEVPFGELLPRLQHGECDLGAARMTRTEERAKVVDFSASFFPVRSAVLQRRGEAVSDIKELAGKRILVIGNSSLGTEARSIPGVILVDEDLNSSNVKQLKAGEVDVILEDSTTVPSTLEKNPDVQLAFFLPSRSYYAFPMPKGSSLKPALDSYLAAIKKDGTYATILKRYMDPETVYLILGSE